MLTRNIIAHTEVYRDHYWTSVDDWRLGVLVLLTYMTTVTVSQCSVTSRQ